MSTFRKGDIALWNHVPADGGKGYAGPRVTVTKTQVANGRVTADAILRDGSTKSVTVDPRNLTLLPEGA